jgi:hypothetical protein
MYPSHVHYYHQNPYHWENYFSPSPFQENFDYSPDFDERQLGQLLPQIGGLMPGFQPPFGPPGQGQAGGPPTSPPPSFVPAQTQQIGTFAVDPGAIRGCLFRFTYLWLRGYDQFWFFPIFVGRNSVSGWRWTGFRWIYSGISLRQIQSFSCF